MGKGERALEQRGGGEMGGEGEGRTGGGGKGGGEGVVGGGGGINECGI